MLLFFLGFLASVLAQCTMKEGYDVVGSNLAQTNVGSLQECCDLCSRTAGCKAAAFWNNICYPKAGDQLVAKAGVTAIVRGGQCNIKDGYDVVGSNIAQTNVNSKEECCALCQRMAECKAAAFWNNICYPKSGDQLVAKAGVSAILKGQGSVPAPAPAPVPQPSGGPLATFLVIGDWGYDTNVHGNAKPACQGIIGSAMQAVARQYKVDFVINVGDSFYPNGIPSRTDGRWQTMWRQYYGDLVNVPWFSVYGNHDYEGSDRCACYDDLSKCAQINPGQSGWFMPGYSYFDTRYLNSLKTEIIALDTNNLVAEDTCKYANCGGSVCQNNLAKRAEAAVNLLEQRIAQSTAKNLLVFSHYPTDYFRRMPRVLDALKTPKYHVEFFGGHRHNVDQRSTVPITPGNSWLVGGGGGWGCDGTEQGFLLGFVNRDYTITTKAQLVDYRSCCN